MIDLDISQLKKILGAGVPRTVQFDGKRAFLNKDKIKSLKDKIKTEGGLLPLAAMLPLIFGGITAAAGIAAGIASTANDAKEAQLADTRRAAEAKKPRKQKPRVRASS